MRKPSVVALFVCLTLFAVSSAFIFHNLKQQHSAQQSQYAQRMLQAKKENVPVIKAMDAAAARVDRKAKELDKLGIKGEERKRLILLEGEAAKKEFLRVRASGYRSAYNAQAR